jgi:hypothetical protein
MDTQTLLTHEQHGDVVATVLDNNPSMDQPIAHRIVDEALKYLATAATFPTAYIQPSRIVDEGWHSLILHTALYANVCEKLGGFVHHYPERPNPERHDETTMARTVALMEEAGHSPDRELWTGPTKTLVPVAASCSHTPVPGGCGPIRPGNCGTHDGK